MHHTYFKCLIFNIQCLKLMLCRVLLVSSSFKVESFILEMPPIGVCTAVPIIWGWEQLMCGGGFGWIVVVSSAMSQCDYYCVFFFFLLCPGGSPLFIYLLHS